jgi:8-oxo-dGTP pyrophosphatase MutT (NUDIX family)
MKHISLQHLPELLPLHVEEGNVREVISREEIVAALAERSGLSLVEARLCIELIESFFESASLLNQQSLAKGNWAFVSFPAYLMARSLAETLATPGQRIFDDSYWEQGAHRPEGEIEEQRRILRFLELQRSRGSAGIVPRPIRYVYVAWGFVKLGEKFLLHHREDRTRPEAGSYVFPGGRLNLSDLPSTQRQPKVLAALFQTASPLAAESLPRTLEREFREELQLNAGLDYSYKPSFLLPAFRQVEGARNNHALTEYCIQVFNIRLTPKGEASLYDLVCREPSRYSWFSPDDLARQALPDGRTTYIDALKSALGTEFQTRMESIPDSSSFEPRFTGDTQLLTIPATPNRPLLLGKTGKEKPMHLNMTPEQWGLLLTLAWHRKGLEFKADEQVATLLPGGWIRLNEPRQLDVARKFATILADAKLPVIEVIGDNYLRASVEMENLYFDDALYTYTLIREGDNDGQLQVTSQKITTPLGIVCAASLTIPIPRNTCRIIDAIRQGRDPESQPNIFSGDLQRDLREKIDTYTRQIGLRKFIRLENKEYVIIPAVTE